MRGPKAPLVVCTDTPHASFSPRLASNTFSEDSSRYYVHMRHLLLILLGFILAAGIGYFVGYDHGFKRMQSAPMVTDTVATAAETMAMVVGKWQSNEDPKFVREIFNDGTVIDRYEGIDDATGLWMVFTKEIPDAAFTGTMEDGAVYLVLGFGEDEKYYFQVTQADAQSLELIYLDRGGVLSFNRVP